VAIVLRSPQLTTIASSEARGVTVHATIDTIIATFCIIEGHELLHNDRDFDPFQRYLGLQVVED
jgi:predicted nucleic acid-binding protein